jgi:hypothetical protein
MRATIAAALCVLALAGCGAGEDIQGGGTIPGGSLTVAVLLPLHGPDAAASRDMIAGAKLALFEAGGTVGDLRVGLAVYDEGVRRPDAVARVAIEDIQVAAVIGGLRSQDAAREIPILDAAGVLHVSPGAADPALVTTPELHPSGQRRTWVLAPDARAQAEAMLAAAGEGPVAIEREAGRDAEALGDALEEVAGDRVRGDAPTLLYAGEDADTALGVARSLRGRQEIVFGDALARAGLRPRLGRAARRATFVAAAPLPVEPPLAEDFEARFGRPPGPYALLGHEAMRRVLSAIRGAGRRATYRQRIIDAFERGETAPLPAVRWP